MYYYFLIFAFNCAHISNLNCKKYPGIKKK